MALVVGGIKIDPQGQSLAVNITIPSTGQSVVAYTATTGPVPWPRVSSGATASFPVTISTPTTFYVTAATDYLVSAKVGSQEVAGGLGHTATVNVDGQVVTLDPAITNFPDEGVADTGTFGLVATAGPFGARPPALVKGQRYVATDVGIPYESLDGSTWTNPRASVSAIFLWDYGCIPDGQLSTTGAITTAAPTILSDANARFLTGAIPAKVGMGIRVDNAGARSGTGFDRDHITTIASIQSDTQLTLSVAAPMGGGANLTNNRYFFGTDNATPLNNAMAGAFALAQINTTGRCQMYAQTGRYLTFQPPSTLTQHQYAIVPIPWFATQSIWLEVVGAPGGSITHYHASAGAPVPGTVFWSMWGGAAYSTTTGIPSFFGGPSYFNSNNLASSPGHSFCNFSVKDCTIRDGDGTDQPHLWAVDAAWLQSAGFDNCQRDTTGLNGLGPTAIPVPTDKCSGGFMLPQVNDNTPDQMNKVSAGGVYVAFGIGELGEHLDCHAAWCVLALCSLPSYFHTHFDRFQDINCIYGIAGFDPTNGVIDPPVSNNWSGAVSSAGGIDIDHWSIQLNNGQTTGFNRLADVRDTSNHFPGQAFFITMNAGSAPVTQAFIRYPGPAPGSGAQQFKAVDLNQIRQPTSPPAVPATTVNVVNPFNRDAQIVLTAAAGGTCTVAWKNQSVVVVASGVFVFTLSSGRGVTLTYGAGNAPTWIWDLL